MSRNRQKRKGYHYVQNCQKHCQHHERHEHQQQKAGGNHHEEFKQKSYDAYLVYVDFIEGKKSISETVDALSPLMAVYGLSLTLENLANLLTVKMTAYGKDKGEQAKKVKSISTFRAFVKGGWKDVEAAPVHSNAGKNPADVKTTAKAKKPTKAEMEAKIAELEALLAASKSEEQKAA